MKSYNFKYFPDYLRWASFTEDNCDCDDGSPCLDPLYFDDSDIGTPICVGDLAEGRVTRTVPQYVIARLENSLSQAKSKDEAKAAMAEAVAELARTPPIPWIQGNDWPAKNGDFCQYIGEWSTDDFNRIATDGDGRSLLWSALETTCKQRRDDVESLWQELIAGVTVAYVFKEINSGELVVVDQSY